MRLASIAFLSSCALLTASVANAGVTAINVSVVQRVAADGNTNYGCSNRLGAIGCVVDGTSQGVGSQDCRDDTQLSVGLSVTGLPDTTGSLQVWAGPSDCTQPGATNNTTTATCWQVAPVPAAAGVMQLRIRVADIAAYAGAPNPPQTYQAAAAAQACTNPAVNDKSTINVYFLWFPNGQTTPTVSSAPIPVKVKLGAPGPCTDVTATSSSDTSLAVTWLPPPGDPTLAGYDVFADPGSACGDASAIDPSQVTVQVAGVTSTEADVSGLKSQTSYATAVAAVDEFGNVGAISPSADCATPGNNLVKGSCGCTTVGAPSGRAGFFALAALLLFGVRRERRRLRARGASLARARIAPPRRGSARAADRLR